MRRLLILVAALALLTTACKIEINADLTINADKSGKVVMEIGMDDEVLALAQAEGGSPDGLFEDMGLEGLPGAIPTQERRGDMEFYIVEIPVDDITDASGFAGGPTEGLTDSFDIQFTDDRVVIRGSTSLDDAMGDTGGGLGGDLGGIPPEMLSEFFSVNIRVTMPGKVLDHNADSVDGNKLTWALDLTTGSIDVFAESDPNASSGGSSSTLIIIIVIVAVVLLAVLAWFFMKNRASEGAEATPEPAAPATDDEPPAPPPEE